MWITTPLCITSSLWNRCLYPLVAVAGDAYPSRTSAAFCLASAQGLHIVGDDVYDTLVAPSSTVNMVSTRCGLLQPAHIVISPGYRYFIGSTSTLMRLISR
jgi:hypothetical protein